MEASARSASVEDILREDDDDDDDDEDHDASDDRNEEEDRFLRKERWLCPELPCWFAIDRRGANAVDVSSAENLAAVNRKKGRDAILIVHWYRAYRCSRDNCVLGGVCCRSMVGGDCSLGYRTVCAVSV